ncbi:MAG: hypothetical protein ACFB0B_17935 [Thermonemataceae bacterium]
MKTRINHYLLSVLVISFAVFGCKSKQKLPKGEEEVIIPCSGPEYRTDKKTFRSNSVGESYDQVTSKKKALSNARAEIASSIQTTVKAVTDNYVNSREFNNREEVEEKYEGLNREVVNQELNGITTICEKLVRTQEGKYKTYIAIELSTNDLLESYTDRMNKLSQNERLRIDYDYEKFKETFNQEMEKMEQR